MIRLAAPTAGVALLLATGCTHEGEWSVRKAFGWDDPPNVVKPTSKEKAMAKLSPADQAVQQRVANVGYEILTRNTFTGLNPEDAARDGRREGSGTLSTSAPSNCTSARGWWISASRKRNWPPSCVPSWGRWWPRRSGRPRQQDAMREPIPDVAGAEAVFPGGTPADVGRQADKPLKNGSRPEVADPAGAARELLKGAGYSPAELDRVEPLLKLSPRSEQIRKQLGGSAPAPDPVWQK